MSVERRVWVIPPRENGPTEQDIANAESANCAEIREKEGANPSGHVYSEFYPDSYEKMIDGKRKVTLDNNEDVVTLQAVHENMFICGKITKDQTINFTQTGDTGHKIVILISNDTDESHDLTVSQGFQVEETFTLNAGKRGYGKFISDSQNYLLVTKKVL